MKRNFLFLCMMCALLTSLGGGQGTVATTALGSASVTVDSDHIPVVALTFDDGPLSSTTTRLLDGLALREVSATFFLVGEHIEGNEDLILRMAEEGHQIGIHSYSHANLSQLNHQDFDLEMGRSVAALSALLPQEEFWLRPPYGMVSDGMLGWIDVPVILWSLDPKDWEDRDSQRIVGEVLTHVQDGDVVLLHDIYDSTVDATLDIVDALLAQGYTFVTVEQLMAQQAVEPQAGVLYPMPAWMVGDVQ